MTPLAALLPLRAKAKVTMTHEGNTWVTAHPE